MVDNIQEISPEERNLYEMSDEELEAAFRQARGEKEASVTVDDSTSSDDMVEVDSFEDDVVDDTEQPDDVDSDELDQGEEENTDNTEDEPEDPDGDDEDNSEDVKEVATEAPKKYTYKANGQEFEFTEEEIKNQFGKVFGQAMNYTQKMQELKPWRTTISALKDNNISHDDVNLMIDVLKGDKDAIAQVIKKAGIDALELDIDNSKYSPREYGRSEKELEIDEVLGTISKDPEYKITQHVVTSQWDARSRSAMAENPEMLNGLHIDVKSGVFDKVMPMAMKMKVLDGGKKSDIDYYMEAGSQYYAQLDAAKARQRELDMRAAQEQARANEQRSKVEKIVERDTKQAALKKEAVKRKAAAPTASRAGKKDVVDYLDDSDESFDNWYKNLNSRY